MATSERYTTTIEIDTDKAMADVEALVALLAEQKAALTAQAEAQAKARGEAALAAHRQREAVKATREAIAAAKAQVASLREQERAAQQLADAQARAQEQMTRDADKAARERERIAQREQRAVAAAQARAEREQSRQARANERAAASQERAAAQERAEAQRHAEAQQARKSELTAESTGALLEILGDPVNPFGALVSGATALASIVGGQLVRGMELYQTRSEEAEAATAAFSQGADNLAVSLVAVADAQGGFSTRAAGLGVLMDDLAVKTEAWGSSLNITRAEAEVFTQGFAGAFTPVIFAGIDALDRYGAQALAARSASEDTASTVTTLALGFGAVADGATLASAALDTYAARLEAIEEKWDDALDNGLAGVIGGAATGATRRGAGGPSGPNPEVKRAYDELLNSIKGQNDELERARQLEVQRLRTIRQIEVRESNRLTDIGDRLAERTQAARAARSGASAGLTDQQSAELERFRARQGEVADALNRSTEAAAGLGVEMAALSLQTLVAGDSFGNFGAKAAQMFGNFASQAGQVLIATAIGEIALFNGNPFVALAAGIALTGIGAVIGGLAQRSLRRGGSGVAPAASRSTGALAPRRSPDDDRRSDGPTIVYVQFGTERLAPAIAHGVSRAQRDGRLPPAFGRASR